MKEILNLEGRDFSEFQSYGWEEDEIRKKLKEENIQAEEREDLERRLHYLKEWMIPEMKNTMRLKVITV